MNLNSGIVEMLEKPINKLIKIPDVQSFSFCDQYLAQNLKIYRAFDN